MLRQALRTTSTLLLFVFMLTPVLSRAQEPEITVSSKAYKRQFKTMLQRAEEGDANAQNSVGGAFAMGDGVVEDDEAAYRWLRKAAEQGHAAAQYNLFLLSTQKRDSENTLEAPVKWLQRAANQGVLQAQFRLAEVYRQSRVKHKKRRERAAMYYAMAAKQGHASAQFYLGWCYDKGVGVTQNESKAARWYLKAAKKGQVDAQVNLAVNYIDGRGVQKSQAQARRWFLRAAQQNSAIAQYNLGKLSQARASSRGNIIEAYVWTSLAAEQGLGAAIRERELLRSLISPSQLSRAQARVRRWSKINSDNAQFDLQLESRRSFPVTEPISGLEALLPKKGKADSQR